MKVLVRIRVNGLAFFYLTYWTTLAPLVCFCKSFGKSFQSLFANSQWYRNRIARSIFRILKILPCFKYFSFD
jgi:hypothetical protein